MKNKSIWQEYQMTNYPQLKADKKVDILIIGGGLTGLNIFYQLQDNEKTIILVDKNRIGQGISARSSAKITYLQEDIYTKLTKIWGLEKAKLYYKANLEAMQKYSQIIQKEKINCDFTKVKSYLLAYNSKDRAKIKQEEKFLTSLGNPNLAKEPINDSLYTYQGIDSYVIHPLKYIDALAKISVSDKHQIYEKTNIIKIEKNQQEYLCWTSKFKITAQTVIIASHYPNFLFPYFFPLKCYLEKSTLIAYKNPNLAYSYINTTKPVYSSRFYQDYALKVGSTHNLCHKNNDFKNLQELTKAKVNYAWTNYDIMTLDHLPLIGYLQDNLIIATGYNTWGLTNSLIASLIIKDLINHKENIYQDLVDPRRKSKIAKLKNYSINIFSNTYAFLASKINKNKTYYQNNPFFTKINKENVGIYIDEGHKEHIVYNKCPHLGCSLVFNNLEKTWDCPCHGSRFSLDGQCILGPSDYNIAYKK